MYTDMFDSDEEEEEIQIRKRHSTSKQRRITRSPSVKKSKKLNKDEIKYQRFVNGLRKDIHDYLNRCLRENHFDPCGKQDSLIRTNVTRQRSIQSWKSRENKRLTADVNQILTGPSLKIFYTEFVQPQRKKSTRLLRPLDESLLCPNEQE